MTVTVLGREPRGMTERPTIIYVCGECGTTGVQGDITAHLHNVHHAPYSVVSKLLNKARYADTHEVKQ